MDFKLIRERQPRLVYSKTIIELEEQGQEQLRRMGPFETNKGRSLTDTFSELCENP